MPYIIRNLDHFWQFKINLINDYASQTSFIIINLKNAALFYKF